LKVINDISQLISILPGACVASTGTFDGVHMGHRKILSTLAAAGKKRNLPSVLVTFWPHPRLVLFPDDPQLKLLSTPEEKYELLASIGIDYLLVIPFSKEFSRMSSLEFVRDLLVHQLRANHLVMGYDHHFGRNREGSIANMKEFGNLYGFSVEEVEALSISGVSLSSSKIRTLLEEGNIALSNQYLGYTYSISFTVTAGNQLGRTIGFPTANLLLANPLKIIPAAGVYGVQTHTLFGSHYGIMNIGTNPTFSNDNLLKLEVHLFDFDGDLYNSQLKVSFLHRIRNEKKFSSKEELVAQLLLDKKAALNFNFHEV
jgi:riboflavin kinase / FMN adenylyltransferase